MGFTQIYLEPALEDPCTSVSPLTQEPQVLKEQPGTGEDQETGQAGGFSSLGPRPFDFPAQKIIGYLS